MTAAPMSQESGDKEQNKKEKDNNKKYTWRNNLQLSRLIMSCQWHECV